MTDTATPLPFTLANHDEAPTRGGSSLDAMPCCGSLDLRLGDCMDVMRTFPDGHFDLAIVDPPYGIGRSKGIGKRKGECVFTEYADKKWDSSPPPQEYWQELERVAENRIVWGANYFGYPFERMIVWDKQIGDNDFSMAEIASHTFKTPTKVISMFCGANRNGRDTTRIHPTQKPVKLYTWILDRFAKPGMRVLDTHMGSGSIAIAAHYAGIHLTACEIDADYYEAATARIARETAQTELFSPHNVKEHAPLSARAHDDHRVEVITTEDHENRAADRGCRVSPCSPS